MKHNRIISQSRLWRMALLALVLSASTVAPNVPTAAAAPAAMRSRDKMKPEEIIAKHLESIGPAESRASVTSHLVIGTSQVTFRIPVYGQLQGRAIMASQGTMNLIGMNFANTNYPYEQVGFDGNDVSFSYVTPGVRSTLGNFFWTNQSVVKQGLLGGTLSAAWPLLNLSTHNAQVRFGGTKKINNREVYELEYNPRGGSDLDISLYFDAETFQHVRTEYRRAISAPMGATDKTSSQQVSTRYKLTEDFSDFRKESSLVLPHTYKISLAYEGARPFQAEWALTLTQFAFNRKFDPKSFDVSAAPSKSGD